MPTVVRFMFVVLISVLHLVSIVLLTLSLVLGSGGLVEAGALSVDWLALIIMAVFLLHRVRFPQREYIRPRSMTAFYGLTFVSAVNLALLSARLATGNRGLVRDFEGVGSSEAVAGAVVAIAAASTLLGITGAYVSHTGCYIEPIRKVPKPLISWPVHDWHPFPTDTPTASPMSPSYGRPRKYIPGLIPAFRGAASPSSGPSERIASQRVYQGSSERLIVPGGYQDMASMRKSIIASSGASTGPAMRVSVYMAGPNGSTFELVAPPLPPPVPPLPSPVATKGGHGILVRGGDNRLQRGGVPVPLQPPAPVKAAGEGRMMTRYR